ncbi:MAG: NAD(P)/FAD-dependent oxidoreductase [Rhodospirillaceae bacterium]|jgi:cation diffusion facilitator CzcD-associated flavoprotein CzcO|nr:NAD(P)/FAD-dependent oxidoreductase [Rhodospirillaceae bacterium]MBT4489256.1 NAD(P)/FAD-dependent oxidoreductase [Rhodospirillaceae bacterium]MBT5190800.1 NAD(P)/FAD-dependent oxidoreductase [Rhodospirillaceae bacterium]MBT5896352.1 NAD(P)/FAD-dependent oxidoreductase [Rhodospirillaceae bacterium]MBT6429496.1 NAD(P)/FAD-dependent oxidoreductase [Rhodospirillaceae bacterium]
MSEVNAGAAHAGAKVGSDFDLVIVGAGFAGMYMLHRARGQGLSARVFEAGSGVGGTWYWNRYPGARCDVESMQYSYQFSEELSQEWEWSERYSPQPEILTYANHVADRFDLRSDIQFDTTVAAAHFNDDTGRWDIETGDGGQWSAQFVVMATGCLSSANMPKFEGLDSFRGDTYHTGHWPHEDVDFTGKRVGVIGTGSSAIQSIPIMAEQATQLTVFQRTPNYMVPAHNAPMDQAYAAEVKSDYGALRERARVRPGGIDIEIDLAPALEASDQERRQRYEEKWAYGGFGFMGAYGDLMLNEEANDTAAEFVRGKIRDVVDDPAVADLLSPHNTFGCKRLCVDSNYWQTYNRDNVSLVDVSEKPIERITSAGLSVDGQEFEFDAIVFATGFDAMTGTLLRIDIQGIGGQKLADKWAEGPKTYLGLSIAGFPNMFTVTGPGSPSVLTNMLPSIEQHVDWISDCLDYMRRNGHARITSESQAEEDWVEHVRDTAGLSLRSECSSWYVGANIPGKPRVFMPYMGGYPAYLEKCAEVVENGYQGFALS